MPPFKMPVGPNESTPQTGHAVVTPIFKALEAFSSQQTADQQSESTQSVIPAELSDDELKAQADNVWDQTRFLIALAQNQMGELRFVNHDVNRSGEISALALLLNGYGDIDQSDAALVKAIGATFKALRADHIHTFIGVEAALASGNPALKILSTLGEKGKISPLALDVAVISALACGEPATAMNLIQLADEYVIPWQSAASLSRLEPTFEKAYQLSPGRVRDRIDAACMSSPNRNLRYKGQTRLRENTNNSHEKWRNAQKVVAIEQREQSLEGENITALIEQAITGGEELTLIETSIKVRAQEIVDGKAANLIGQALSDRCNPQFNVERQMELRAQKAKGQEVRGIILSHSSNLYELATYKKAQATREERERERAIQLIAPERDPLNPDNNGFNEVIAFLKDPEAYKLRFTQTKDAHRGKDVMLLAQRLIGGVGFIDTLSQNTYTKALLQKEFGLGTLVEERSLATAHKALQEMFKDPIYGSTTVSVYQNLQQPTQSRIDLQDAINLEEMASQEVTQLTTAKMREVQVIAESLLASSALAVSQETQTLAKAIEGQNTQKSTLQQKIDSAPDTISQLQINLTNAQKLPTQSGWVFKTNNLELIAARNQAIATATKALNEAIKEVDTMKDAIAAIQGVDETKLKQLQQRSQRLTNLQEELQTRNRAQN